MNYNRMITAQPTALLNTDVVLAEYQLFCAYAASKYCQE